MTRDEQCREFILEALQSLQEAHAAVLAQRAGPALMKLETAEAIIGETKKLISTPPGASA
jgi:hypothetical protein